MGKDIKQLFTDAFSAAIDEAILRTIETLAQEGGVESVIGTCDELMLMQVTLTSMLDEMLKSQRSHSISKRLEAAMHRASVGCLAKWRATHPGDDRSRVWCMSPEDMSDDWLVWCGKLADDEDDVAEGIGKTYLEAVLMLSAKLVVDDQGDG